MDIWLVIFVIAIATLVVRFHRREILSFIKSVADAHRDDPGLLSRIKRFSIATCVVYLLTPIIGRWLGFGMVQSAIKVLLGMMLTALCLGYLPWSRLTQKNSLFRMLETWEGDIRFARIIFAVLLANPIIQLLRAIPSVLREQDILTVNSDPLYLLGVLLVPALLISGLVVPSACSAILKQGRSRFNVLNQLRRDLRSCFTFDYPFVTLIMCFLLSCFLIGFGALSNMVSNWLRSSMADARLPLSPSELPSLCFVIKAFIAGALAIGLFPRAVRAAAEFANFSQCVAANPRAAGVRDGILNTGKCDSSTFVVRDARSWLRNIAGALAWFVFCYASIFSLVAFCPGALGQAIVNWLNASIESAHLHLDLTNSQQLRLFLASIVALYGCVPVAITSCVFLPLRKLPEIIIKPNGIFVPDGFTIAMFYRPYRLWNDIKKIDVSGAKSDLKRGKVLITFHSGGWIAFKTSQLELESISTVLGSVDEFADRCIFTKRALQFFEELNQAIQGDKFANKAKSGTFRSTIFEPFVAGHEIKDGELRVVRQLSSRPCAAVYLVRRSDNMLATLKQFVLPVETEKNLRLQQQFQREYELLSSINHPQICKVLDVFEEDGTSYLLLEYSRGRDLRKLVEHDGSREEIQVTGWSRQICEIMIYLHSREPQILHRDLSPDNLIQGEDGLLKLVDFGAAHHFMEGVTGTLIGKQCYMAPEQLRGKATPCSDIYSFGAVLSYLVTGKDPRALAPSSPLEQGAQISSKLNELIKWCTAFDQKDRPQSFIEVRNFIDQGKRPDITGDLEDIIYGKAGPVEALKPACIDATVLQAPDEPQTLELGKLVSDGVRVTTGSAEGNEDSNEVIILRPKETIEVESPK